MKILVTGGAGFIGSNIVDAYVNQGHSVCIIDNLSTGKKENINSKANFYQVDITDDKNVSEIFRKENFDIVNHHAAQIDVRKSVEDPIFDSKINIQGSLNLLENSRKSGIKKFIFASSGGTIYGECGNKPPIESATANPLSPYGIAKHSVELYLKYYSYVHGLKFVSLRYANVYGPRQDPFGEAGVVAIFSMRMIQNENVFIFGNGKQTRDYVYVKDVVLANIRALTKGKNEIINIGTGKETSVKNLYQEMATLIKYSKHPFFKPARKGELSRSYLNISKASKILRWKPDYKLKEGLKNTIEYFLKKEAV